ncbi:group II intron reverse transcriptase/maturase [Streptococcus chenjunshii]|uniref:Group II intron reverse transcriptase/maturase n=1 Tax=Streptococcus chenjunshii TaxID=2173853 RepID=A0A372KPH2_9STRE|nr:group II intron reverse transcriptase/maturase [Streptococcus chenjunshii]AXQ77979.1 group II intron reverse transcriptase/maturase [Streptococcus chenjunshii]RFU51777.1 group II intron reverse transcriptase/maturase [Streptococcus chenjunshii]RFU53866.1 group II intron reverse transcriptase/maturase [Streptococcus chenjunshii]
MSKLLDNILSRSHMLEAYNQVKANKGSAGIDGITIDDIDNYLRQHWRPTKELIKQRKYKPQPVLRVDIPKLKGGVRQLGIPTVMDRMIQQAIVQVLSPICEPHFSEMSYGFRPNRSCGKAIVKLLDYLNEGYEWIVDIDLEKFFDRVPQDRLMSLVHNIIQDGDTESLIRKYLHSGVVINGQRYKTLVGTPQGGNLSPLLSNIMLNELDKELESRGLRFVRYADDCVITVGSEAAAKRVMYSVSRFIEKRLGLKVNMTKTKIVRPGKLKYLGFGFWKSSEGWKSRPHQDSVVSFKRKLKKLTTRKWSIDLDSRIEKLNWLIRGWLNYFSMTSMKSIITSIDERLRTRVRVIIWKQWKKKTRRLWGLLKLGVPKWIADKVSGWGDHYQLAAQKSVLKRAISKQVLVKRGLISCLDYYLERHALKVS